MEIIKDPRLRNCLKRKRLNQLLTPQEDNRVITITADSGYGKTRAVLDYLTDREYQVIWVTLTASDNDVSHFWEKFSGSVKAVNDEIGTHLKRLGFPTELQVLKKFVEELINEIYKDDPVILVFDDFHAIYNKKILDFINNLIMLDSESVFLYIISRFPVKVSGNNKKEQNIDAEQLIFTMEEIETYFGQKDMNLSRDLLQEIYEKTSGWPCAVYLLSLTAENNKGLLKHSTHFSDSLIYDTIDQEIFSKYSEDEQNFLIRLSLIEFHPTQLIEELFGNEMEKYYDSLSKNIFIRHNRHTNVFECHQIFWDFLKNHQKQLTKAEILDICQKTGEWFRKYDMIADAIACYKRAENYDALWEIISELVPGYFTPEFSKMLIDIIERLPKEFVYKNPMIHVVKAALYMSFGDLQFGKKAIKAVINAMKKQEENSINRHAVGEAYLELAFYEMHEGSLGFKEHFKMAWEYLQTKSSMYNKPYMFLLNGDPITLKRGEKGELGAWIKAVEEAEPYYSKLLGGQMDGLAALCSSMGYYYQGNTKGAEEYAIKAIYQGKANNQIDIICNGYFSLMRVAILKGDYKGVWESLEQISNYTNQVENVCHLSIQDVAYGLIYAKLDLNRYIADWIIDEKVYSMTFYDRIIGYERIVKANSMLNNNEYYEMIPYLQESQTIYAKRQKYMYLIHAHILLAIAYYNIKELDKTVEAFYKAYQLSYENNIIMPFAVYGKFSRSMISGLRKWKQGKNIPMSGVTMERLSQISSKWLDNAITKANTFAKKVSIMREQYLREHPDLQEEPVCLTKREREILAALCEGLTREEIADNLDISVNTIKSSLNIIYAKLGAINSAHAVRIAMLREII